MKGKVNLSNSQSVCYPKEYHNYKLQVSKGLGNTKDSISTHQSNILYDIASAFHSREKIDIETHMTRLKEIKRMSKKMFEVEREVSDVLKNLDFSKKTQPLLDVAGTLAKTLSSSLNAVIGLELLSVGAPIVGSVFLTSSALAAADLSGFFSKYKTQLDKLNLASSVAAIAAGNYAKALNVVLPQTVNTGVSLLNGTVQAGSSFNKSMQDSYKTQYIELQQVKKKIEFSLTHFLKEVEKSFESEKELRANINHQILTNLNLDS